MLPATQATLVSRMHTTYPTGNVSAELGRYLQTEYGVDAPIARTMIENAARARPVRIRNGNGSPVRRFLVAVSEAFGASRGTPEGA